ncbi:MAG TPA: FKBP-type peptidyl-prolyl cis-trans isomerase [Gemmataceae bacterium]|nr:FKBP-type peptidyl-prolyl cis-trans isomerase [Gemmataceae bacterium]
MQTVQPGDRVQVHYVKRFQDGSATSSRDRAPLELTVGVDHPRLPGLGLALVGLAPGASTKVSVPVDKGYGPADPSRIRRCARSRFPKDQSLAVGQWVRLVDRQGRPHAVRVVKVHAETVVVDTNRRGAGQSVELEVKLIGILPVGRNPQGP